jgi:LAO/AO transport system kinase
LEVEVTELADICVVVSAPNMGDDVQAMKAGVLEIADVLVVNKADLPLAERTTRQLRDMLKLRRDRRDIAIVETVATEETGVDGLSAAIDGLLAGSAGDKRKNRERRMRRLIAQAATRIIDERLGDLHCVDMDVLVRKVAAGEIGIGEAAQAALKMVH